MKKLIAILLLAVYLFNLAGYSLVFHYFIHQSEEKFAQQLSANKYNDADLVQVSTPLHLPYIQNSSGFETLNGSLEINGMLYNYVKRKIYNDTLYIMCLPNQQTSRLVKEKSKYAGEVNDFASGKKEKEPVAKKASPSTEYNNTISQYRLVLPDFSAVQQNTPYSFFIPPVIIDLSAHPPQLSC